jgi:hypothetical protein
MKIKVPFVDPYGNSGDVLLEKLFIAKNDIIEAGACIARIRTDDDRIVELVSNYCGTVLEVIVAEYTLVRFREEIGTLELGQDPINCEPVAFARLV